MLVAVLFLLVVSQSQADQVASCPPPIWLPEGADFTSCGYSHRALSTAGVSIAYDGSKVPDCSAMPGLDVNDTVFVAHEYGEILMRPLLKFIFIFIDCGRFWMCGPEGPCLRECAACNFDPITCPDGKLEFDCRFLLLELFENI